MLICCIRLFCDWSFRLCHHIAYIYYFVESYLYSLLYYYYYYYYYYTPFWVYSPALADGFSLVFDWKQISRTLLSILTDLNNAVIWMVSTCPMISKCSRPITNPLGIVPSAQITSDITVTFCYIPSLWTIMSMFHSS